MGNKASITNMNMQGYSFQDYMRPINTFGPFAPPNVVANVTPVGSGSVATDGNQLLYGPKNEQLNSLSFNQSGQLSSLGFSQGGLGFNQNGLGLNQMSNFMIPNISSSKTQETSEPTQSNTALTAAAAAAAAVMGMGIGMGLGMGIQSPTQKQSGNTDMKDSWNFNSSFPFLGSNSFLGNSSISASSFMNGSNFMNNSLIDTFYQSANPTSQGNVFNSSNLFSGFQKSFPPATNFDNSFFNHSSPQIDFQRDSIFNRYM